MEPDPSSTAASPTADRNRLRSELDRLARSGRGCLLRWRVRVALREAGLWAPVALVAGPILWLLLVLAGALPANPGWVVPAAFAIAGPPVYILARALFTRLTFSPSRSVALSLHDRNLASKDRLVTADEFLASPDLDADSPHSGFMRAAVDDARASAERALAAPLPPLPVPDWRIRPASWWGVPAAVAVILLGGAIVGLRTGGLHEETRVARADAVTSDSKRETQGRPNRRKSQPPSIEMVPKDELSPPSPKQPPLPSRMEQPMDGQPGNGGGSQASASNSSSHAAGQASTQRGEKKDKKPEAVRPPDPESKDDTGKPKPKKKKPETGQAAADANTGQGKASSTNSAMTLMDAPEVPDKSGLTTLADTEDEGAEDEDEQEKSNSVSKPITNEKDPPVDKNLSTRPPDDSDQPANGRGGPNGLKKSRGVPSMILGVPVPDRVPGTPGPGRSKVAQEFTRPKEESHPPLEAEARTPISGPIGHVEQPDLPPWRRALIENYFTSIRAPAEPGESETAPSASTIPETAPQP